MLIRIRCKDGNFRFELQPTSDISELVQKVVEAVGNVDPSSIMLSNQPRGGEASIANLRDRNLQSLGLKHGDLVFVSYTSPELVSTTKTQGDVAASGQSIPESSSRPWENVVEDPVDTYWRASDGKIQRGRDPKLCRHGAKAMCDHCMPLEPYDSSYHTENSIKHLSYHAYLHKLSSGSSSTAAGSLPLLTPLSYKVKVPCPNANHQPWPEGICTACQPSAITLQPQSFRMVDHLEFSSNDMVDRFLQAWRATGTQRFGWLIGHYEPYDKVPMGIKAVVEAIHEPPQEGELDGLTLGLPWEDERRIRRLAASFPKPLSIVGYMFTDLQAREDDRSKSLYKRHAQSFYLSCLEVIFAARLQMHNPVTSRSSSTGLFSSRLVTAVATGTKEGGIDIAAYQVSEQACAMVDADLIEPSVDPAVIRVKEEERDSENARYVPDVFFRYKNSYGLEVQKSAKPSFPVEYLLVNVSHGFPQNPSPMFYSNKFSIENRPGLEDQDIQKVLRSLKELKAPSATSGGQGSLHLVDNVVKFLSDWHLLAFLETTHLISENDLRLLVTAVTGSMQTDVRKIQEAFQTDGWRTLMTFTEEMNSERPIQDSAVSQDIIDEIERMEAMEAETINAERTNGPTGGVKICPHCTYENQGEATDCEVCGLPLS